MQLLQQQLVVRIELFEWLEFYDRHTTAATNHFD